MSEIPADVMETAREAVRGKVAIFFPVWGQEGFKRAYDEIVALEAIARAILAERERCVKITRAWKNDLAYGELIEAAIHRLADRIARGEQP
jgi:hypothetical protein